MRGETRWEKVRRGEKVRKEEQKREHQHKMDIRPVVYQVFHSRLARSAQVVKRLELTVLVGHELQNLVGNTVAAHTTQTLIIHVLQDLVVPDRLVRVSIHGLRQPGEEQVNVDAAHFESDACVAVNWHTGRHVLMPPEPCQTRSEEIVATDVRGSNAQRVNSALRVDHAKSEGTECHNPYPPNGLAPCESHLQAQRSRPLDDCPLDLLKGQATICQPLLGL